jgi:hypothetical protein
MEARSIPPRSDVALTTTSPRLTPTPPRASRFGEVLTNTVVRSAESAVRSLPGSPMMALAVRSATGPGAVGVPLTPTATPTPSLTPGRSGSAEGPLATGSLTAPTGVPGVGSPLGVGAGGSEAASVEASLQQSQDMNLYYLQVQELVNAQNRSFTTLSNVLKAQHDTVKTAIGNIR